MSETFPARLADAVPHSLENDLAAAMLLEFMNRTRPQHVGMAIGATPAQTLARLVLLRASIEAELTALGVTDLTTEAAGAGRIGLTSTAQTSVNAAAAALPPAP